MMIQKMLQQQLNNNKIQIMIMEMNLVNRMEEKRDNLNLLKD